MEEVIKKKFKIPAGKNALDLCAIGDTHIGQRYHDKKPYERNKKWLFENKEYELILMGDMIECAGKHSKGYADQVMSLDDQIDQVIEDFGPFADEGRIWGLLEGNHELRAKESDIQKDVIREISKALNIKNLGTGAVFYVNIKDESSRRGQNYTIYTQHGETGARTKNGKATAIFRMKDTVNNADLYLMGHVHDLIHDTYESFEIDRGNVRILKQHFVITGGYLKYWGSYAHRKGYPASGTSGSPKIKLHTDEKKISVKL